mmetsp:Transcript_44594/g.110553  ORF Transcript_44594/g.110553 Transcript_44594/m.110553 type:complete len:244 (+) Transcript_44594:391-1122(+)
MVVCTHTSVVTPAKSRCVISRASSCACSPVAQKAPFPGLCTTNSPATGVSSATIALPGSPRTSTLPRAGSLIWPTAVQRTTLLGGKSDRSGAWHSIVWITVSPAARAAASIALAGAREGCRSATSLPSDEAKPPSSKKSRWKSIMTSASLAAGATKPGAGSASLTVIVSASANAADERRGAAPASTTMLEPSPGSSPFLGIAVGAGLAASSSLSEPSPSSPPTRERLPASEAILRLQSRSTLC